MKPTYATSTVANKDGDTVYAATSDTDAVKWWRSEGSPADYMHVETGVSMQTLADKITTALSSRSWHAPHDAGRPIGWGSD